MIFSIITINRNNAVGLRKTIESVLNQNIQDFEYIIVDGASTDDSLEIIKSYETSFTNYKYVSEGDDGIYNAMNKGIKMATGEYVEFLNSGDVLASSNVLNSICTALQNNDFPEILYGNLLKDMPNGVLCDKSFAGRKLTFLDFYTGTLNHSSAFIRKSLFEKYGLYDETLKIVSDWKWFLQVIIFQEVSPIYANINITLFDMGGTSEINKELDQKERETVLSSLFPKLILNDYKDWSKLIVRLKRLQKSPRLYNFFMNIERLLFKLEKRNINKTHINAI